MTDSQERERLRTMIKHKSSLEVAAAALSKLSREPEKSP